jgi:hypothetical protein
VKHNKENKHSCVCPAGLENRLPDNLRYAIICLWSRRVTGWWVSLTWKRWEVVQMEYTYDILSLLFLGGNFLIALLAYIDRNNKRK